MDLSKKPILKIYHLLVLKNNLELVFFFLSLVCQSNVFKGIAEIIGY